MLGWASVRQTHAAASDGSCTPKLHATVADDGVGGAEAGVGSGLIGLVDSVDALGGRLVLESPPQHGTTIAIRLPLVPPAVA
jgi:glucose-6-phosphate-specific signal transduction histidine kinase